MVLGNTKLGAPEDKKSTSCAVFWAVSVYNVPWLQSEHDAQITKACVSRKLFTVNEGMFETLVSSICSLPSSTTTEMFEDLLYKVKVHS